MTGVSRAMFPTKALKSYRGRGQIYSWLRAHHEAVAERLASDEATWPSLAAEMASHGVTGRRGDPPTAKAAAKVWHRVRGDLRKAEVADAERRAAAATKASRPGSVYPSRISPDWRPQQVLPPAVPTPASSLPALASAGAGPPAPPAPHVPRPAQQAGSRLLVPFADNRTQEEIDAYVDEQLSLIDEELKAYDRKRFGFGGG